MLLAAVLVAAGAGGALGALATGALKDNGPSARAARRAPTSQPARPTPSSPSGAPSYPAAAGDPAATTDPAAFYAGEAMRGNGDTAIPLARAQRLAAQVPAGAAVERSSNSLRFTTSDVRFVALASPPGDDMHFRIAGMTDPTITVPNGAEVTVRFINGDNDMAHMWLLARGPDPAGAGATIAGGRPLGDPTAAGQQAETIAFQAPAPGTYHYFCAFPTHAMQGMEGRFVVESS